MLHNCGTLEFELFSFLFGVQTNQLKYISNSTHLKLSSVREDNLNLLCSTDVTYVQVPRELLARVPHQSLHLEHQVVAAGLDRLLPALTRPCCRRIIASLTRPRCRRTLEDIWLPCSDMIQFFSPLISYRHLPRVLTM